MKTSFRDRGFTIVELLIVIVVIGILAAITLVAYSGLQQKASKAAVASTLSQAAKKANAYYVDNGSYPASLSAAGITSTGDVALQYSMTGTDFCMTGTKNGKLAQNITSGSTPVDGPCEGQSGGTDYCPSDSFMAVNGYYCDGSEGSVASLNTNAVKLASSVGEVPAGAPAGFVGKQTIRDNYMNNNFTVAPGEIYCVQEWVATASSTVSHALGLQIMDTTAVKATTWQNSTASTGPTSTWKKISGCITIPAGYNSARFWSQNNGANADTALVPWYQTAIKITKQ